MKANKKIAEMKEILTCVFGLLESYSINQAIESTGSNVRVLSVKVHKKLQQPNLSTIFGQYSLNDE